MEKGTEEQIVNQGNLLAVIYAVVYSPNGQLIASVDGDGHLHVWKPEIAGGPAAPKMVLGANAHTGGAYQVAFSPKMDALYTCGGDKTAPRSAALRRMVPISPAQVPARKTLTHPVAGIPKPSRPSPSVPMA